MLCAGSFHLAGGDPSQEQISCTIRALVQEKSLRDGSNVSDKVSVIRIMERIHQFKCRSGRLKMRSHIGRVTHSPRLDYGYNGWNNAVSCLFNRSRSLRINDSCGIAFISFGITFANITCPRGEPLYRRLFV